MITSQSSRTRTGPRKSAIPAALVLIAAAAIGVVGFAPGDDTPDAADGAPGPGVVDTSARPTTGASTIQAVDGGPGRGQAPPLIDDEDVRGNVTVFDDRSAAVANLDPALLAALRKAATEARGDGVEFQVNSGWRSAAYQEQLLREAVAKYGSEKEAERWVATPETSAHVSGDAVDLGPSYAVSWLSRHGAPYGLCQIYRNEPWHYELRPGAVDRGCPAMYADPTQDPRMQR